MCITYLSLEVDTGLRGGVLIMGLRVERAGQEMKLFQGVSAA